MSSVPNAQFTPTHGNTADRQWFKFPGSKWGIQANWTTEDVNTAEFFFPLVVSGIVEGGPADKLSLLKGDCLLTIQVEKVHEDDTPNAVHDIFAEASQTHPHINVLDKHTKLLLSLAPMCKIYVHMRKRCETPQCDGELQECLDNTDHCLVCIKCGLVANSRMTGTCTEEMSEVQLENRRLHRLPPQPDVDMYSGKRTETKPSFRHVAWIKTSEQQLRSAERNESRSTSAPGVKTQNSIHQAEQTQALMQQICTEVQLQPDVPARALDIFKDNRTNRRRNC